MENEKGKISPLNKDADPEEFKKFLEQCQFLGVHSEKDGAFTLGIEMTPTQMLEFNKKFAGKITETDRLPLPIKRNIKYNKNSLIGKATAEFNEQDSLNLLTSAFNKASDYQFNEQRKKFIDKKVDNYKKSLADSGMSEKEIARAEIVYRDKLGPTYLDVRRRKRVDQEEAIKLYERSNKEYIKNSVYGSSIDLLVDFCVKDFKHEVVDQEIKDYFDAYVHDTKLRAFVGNIFLSLLLNGLCHIYTAESEYSPDSGGISSIPGKPPTSKSVTKEDAKLIRKLKKVLSDLAEGQVDTHRLQEACKKEIALRQTLKSSPSVVPTEFSILDPALVEVDDSLFYEDKQRLVLTSEALVEIKDLIERSESTDPEDKLTERERELLKLLPSKLKQAAKDREDYILDPNLTYSIFYRKLNYQRNARPPFARVFDDLDYKEELKKADYATIDGIVNYILLINVGDKDSPATSSEELNAIADAVDTPAKAYHLIWNHTLNAKYVTPERVSDILGEEKYKPVNEDIMIGLGITRALLDGTNISQGSSKLVIEALNTKIKAIRALVTDFLYDIYKKVAANAGFDHYPAIRWAEETISLDSLATRNTNISNQIINKHLSFRTGLELMGRNPDSEIARLRDQLELEREGIISNGSAFQKSRTSDGDGSSGRPSGQVVTDVDPSSDRRNNDRTPTSTSPSQTDRASE